MPGLTVVVASPDPVRLRSAARIAAVAAALGQPVRLFLDEEAVPLARTLTPADGPTGHLLATCLDLGVEVILCQSGLAAAGMDLSTLDPRIAGGGLAGLFGTLGTGRLVTL